MRDRKKFSEFMSAMGEIFDKEVTKTLSAVYWKALESFSDEECEGAFKSALATCRFFPKPADLLEHLDGDSALNAWVKLEKAIRAMGGGESVKFDDPAIHSAIEIMGGWQSVDNWMEDEMKWKQKDFERIYKLVRRRESHPEYLIGKHEEHNRGRYQGFVKPPMMIAGGKHGVKILAAPTNKMLPEGSC